MVAQLFSMRIQLIYQIVYLKNYLKQPYVFYLNTNSSYLANLINREASIFHMQ